MRLLAIHCDYIEYETKKAIKRVAETIDDERKTGRLEEALAAFIAVEKTDEPVERAAEKAAAEISAICEQVNADRVMVYPYAHLSSNLGRPKAATETLIRIEELLKERELTVARAPFGWYKAFKLSCKGHPLSELSREIRPEDLELTEPTEPSAEAPTTREAVVEGIESEYRILMEDGSDLAVDFEALDTIPVLEEHPALKQFIISEEVKGQPSKEPPSFKTMQRLELIDYEPASDSGHFRFYPKGTLIFNLLKDWAERIAVDQLECIEIETPILYDWGEPDIRSQGQSFHERHYIINLADEKREFVLRFAGDFGLFRMLKGATMSYRHLPIRVYEFSKSFRREKRGELSGLKRLRAFHMPDIHSFSVDIDQGWEQYEAIYRAYTDFADGIGVEYAIAFRIVDEFYEKYKDRIAKLLKYSGKPAFIEILSEMKHYWAVKNEFQGLDSVGGNCQLATVQLDVKDAEVYGITYADSDGEQKGCTITHSSIGSIERWIYEILEDALKKPKPVLPFWLSPTQVRFIPVRGEFAEPCLEFAKGLPARVDVDDRDLGVGRKIRDAEREWIPYIFVYGEKEESSGKLSARLRDRSTKEFTLETLKAELEAEQKGYPFRRLPLPKRVSRRVIFRG